MISAAGLALAGEFKTDPITASPDMITTSGKLHSFGGMLGIAGLLATLLISRKLYFHKTWRFARRAILLSTGLVLLGFAASTISLGVMLSRSSGKFGPDMLIGWPNRFGISTGCVWLMTIAWQAVKASYQLQIEEGRIIAPL